MAGAAIVLCGALLFLGGVMVLRRGPLPRFAYPLLAACLLTAAGQFLVGRDRAGYLSGVILLLIVLLLVSSLGLIVFRRGS